MKTAIFTALTILFSLFAQAQQVFPFGTIDQVESKELGETRILNIYLPDGYHPDSAATYPVVYLLDGSANEDYPHIAGLVQFMSMYGLMPQSIVVGIANVDRKRDFTFPTSIAQDKTDFPTTGGSAKFITFIEKELQPYINKTYKTSGRNTIIGQSLGGLLATEILLRKPDLFTDYIIVSPSLWWNNESLLAEVPTFLKANPAMSKNIYFSRGDEGKVMNGDLDKMVGYFKKYAPNTVKWHYVPFLQEDHATILHRSVYKGFELLNPQAPK